MVNHLPVRARFILWPALLILAACTPIVTPDSESAIDPTTIAVPVVTPTVTATTPALPVSPTASPTPRDAVVRPRATAMSSESYTLVYPPQYAYDSDTISVEQVAGVEGEASAIYVQENLGYAGIGSALVIFDLEEGKALTQVSSMQLPEAIQDIKVVGGYAYLALGESGLWIVDVADVSFPQKAAVYAAPGFSIALDCSQEYVYLATHSMGLWVIDVSSPSTPLEVGSFEFPTRISDVIFVDDIGYIATTSWTGQEFMEEDSGVYIIDVSQPDAIREINFWGTYDDYAGSQIDVPVKKLSVDGDFLYILVGWEVVPGKVNRIRVFDISQPENLTEVGDIVLGYFVMSNVIVSDGYAYITTQSCDYIESGGCGGWLAILDISDLNAPVEFNGPQPGFCRWGSLAQDMMLMGNNIYIAAGDEGLRSYEVIELEQ